MTNLVQNEMKLTDAQLGVLATMQAKARTVELRRRAGGIGHVVTLTHAQIEEIDSLENVIELQRMGILVPHYKNFQKIVLPEGVELPAVAA